MQDYGDGLLIIFVVAVIWFVLFINRNEGKYYWPDGYGSKPRLKPSWSLPRPFKSMKPKIKNYNEKEGTR